jgi:hypothetical protein
MTVDLPELDNVAARPVPGGRVLQSEGKEKGRPLKTALF